MEGAWAFEWLPSSIKKMNPFGDASLDNKLQQSFNEMVAKLYDNFEKVAPIVYCACFSAAGDLLSQWRGYADDGKGIAIGFDLDILFEIAKDEPNIYINDIKYVDDDLFENQLLTKLIPMQAEHTLTNLLFYKNPAFVEEKEWRLIYNKVFSKTQINDFIKPLSEDFSAILPSPNISKAQRTIFNQCPVFEVRDGRLKSHLTFCFKDYIEDGIISNIVIGPKAQFGVDDIKAVCAINHIKNIIIEKSKASYR